MEIWKTVKELSGGYMVSSFGRLKRKEVIIYTKNGNKFKKKERILKISIGHNGYSKITIKGKNFRISRLVAEHFIPNPENKPHVNHKNGIKSDNTAINLEWCTLSENMVHAYDTGLCKSGSEHYHANIVVNTESGVFHLSVKEAAKVYGFVYGSLVNMLNGRSQNNTCLEYV